MGISRKIAVKGIIQDVFEKDKLPENMYYGSYVNQKYAKELGQKYFPNSHNIWARPNIEAQCVENACIEMAIWMDKHYSLNLTP